VLDRCRSAPGHRASLETVAGLDHIADRLAAIRDGKPGRLCSF
jgi:hypothetical protein